MQLSGGREGPLIRRVPRHLLPRGEKGKGGHGFAVGGNGYAVSGAGEKRRVA